MTGKLAAVTGGAGGSYVDGTPGTLRDRHPPEKRTVDTRLVESQLDEWEAAGLLTHQQADAILGFERSRPLPTTRRFGRMIGIVSMLGVVLMAAGVALFVASNWQAIPDAMKLSALVVAVIGLEWGGWHLREAGTYPRAGEAVILLGYLLYGSGIHLIAQTYHRPLDDPSLLLWWFLPALPLAHLARSGATAIVGIGVGYGALAVRLDEWLTGAEGLAWAGVYMAIGATLLAVGEWASGRIPAGIARAYRLAGAATALVLLFLGGFRFWYGDAAWPDWTGAATSLTVALIALAALSAGLLTSVVRRSSGPARSLAGAEAAVVGTLFLFAFIWAIGPAVAPLLGYLVTNLALLGVIGWLVFLGIVERREGLVNLGIAVFALAVITRYFEVGFGMLGTGVSFIFSGLVLVGVGFGLEKLRRRLLAEISPEEVRDAT